MEYIFLAAAAVLFCLFVIRDNKDDAAAGVVTEQPPKPVSNDGKYGGRFTSPNKRLCIDPPLLDQTGHGECGQRYTLEGNISFTIKDNTVKYGNLDFYGYVAELTHASPIDANGNFTFSMAHANGRARVVNGSLFGVVWEGPYEMKYGEFTFNKQ